MAIIFHQAPPIHSFFKLITFSLPLFCLLLSWASSATTPPPPPSAVAASVALSSRGYSLFASAIIAATAAGSSFNATGTILASPDFAFSFPAAKFNHRRHVPSRPSTSLLLHHTLDQRLTWLDLKSRAADGGEIRTLYRRKCVLISMDANGDISIAGSKKPIMAVKIRQPDLYVDDHLTVHGLDGVLDPASASKCSLSEPMVENLEIKSQINRPFLDYAVMALKRRGFFVVATAIAVKRSELINLTAVTVFAPSDTSLFSLSGGFRYDFRRHVVPKRLRFAELARRQAETVIETIDPNKTLVVRSVDGTVTVNGLKIDSSEVYNNRWIVVVSVSRTLDDAGDSEVKSQISGEHIDSGSYRSPPTPPNYSAESNSEGNIHSTTGLPNVAIAGVPSTAPIYSGENREFPGGFSDSSHATVSTTSSSDSGESSVQSQFVHAGVPSPAPSHSDEAESNDGITDPSGSSLTDSLCSPAASVGVVPAISVEVEGGDLFCPVTARRSRDPEALNSVDVAQSPSSDADIILDEVAQSSPSDTNIISDDGAKSQPSKAYKEPSIKSSDREDVSLADDVFFYD